jgi:hypothetical protein
MKDKKIKEKRIGGVSVNLDTPPKRKDLERLMAFTGRSEEQIKDAIDGSKLYGSVSKKPDASTERHKSDKDS